MLDNSEGKEVKQDYLEVLNAILRKLLEKGKFQGVEPSKEISIFTSNKLVYKGAVDQEPLKNEITPELVETLDKALSEPQNLQGSIRIMIGNEKLLHLRDGEVISDKLGLLENQAQQQTQSQAQKSEIPKSIDDLQQQLNSLQQKVEEQQMLIDSQPNQSSAISNLMEAFERQQKTIDNLQKGLENIINRRNSNITNSRLQNWVGNIESKVKQTSSNLFEKVKSALTPEVVKLRKQVEQQVADIKSQVDQQVNSLKDEVSKRVDDVLFKADTAINSAMYDVNKKIADVREDINNSVKTVKGKAIESGVKTMLHLFGERKPDGSVSFESNNFDFQQNGRTVMVKAKDGREVMKDGVLTADASEKDIESLEQVQFLVDEHLNHSESESRSRNLGR
ncbi:hypothetical protein [Nodularia sp. NIES-3585]|uniref:hypothetical protein n=1 Tax=Nodularia sp. NIES-3585 TaxID=1973477 RepID=UPI000B5C5880|nr:hypothetical protein [Nodularia sp. NIES-3585]GAX39000.1 hypothetical protein NIES3585_50520 [Nodularia sp. NIES-3585]